MSSSLNNCTNHVLAASSPLFSTRKSFVKATTINEDSSANDEGSRRSLRGSFRAIFFKRNSTTIASSSSSSSSPPPVTTASAPSSSASYSSSSTHHETEDITIPPHPQEQDPLVLLTRKGEAMLQSMQTAVDSHEVQIDQLNDKIAYHLDRAKARLVGANELGAVLSMKKVKHLQARRSQTMEAIDYLETQQIELLTWLAQAKSTTTLNRGPRHQQLLPPATRSCCAKATAAWCGSSGGRDSSSTQAAALTNEFKNFNGVGYQVQKILSEENAPPLPSDAALLDDLRTQMLRSSR